MIQPRGEIRKVTRRYRDETAGDRGEVGRRLVAHSPAGLAVDGDGAGESAGQVVAVFGGGLYVVPLVGGVVEHDVEGVALDDPEALVLLDLHRPPYRLGIAARFSGR